jgi:hypothetical protein
MVPWLFTGVGAQVSGIRANGRMFAMPCVTAAGTRYQSRTGILGRSDQQVRIQGCHSPCEHGSRLDDIPGVARQIVLGQNGVERNHDECFTANAREDDRTDRHSTRAIVVPKLRENGRVVAILHYLNPVSCGGEPSAPISVTPQFSSTRAAAFDGRTLPHAASGAGGIACRAVPPSIADWRPYGAARVALALRVQVAPSRRSDEGHGPRP